MLEEIKKKIQTQVSQSHNKIITSYFQILIEKHNSSITFCNCEYCYLTRIYTRKKQEFHFKTKLRWNDDWQYHYRYYGKNELYSLIQEIKKLKIKKDNLKKLKICLE